MENSVDPDQPPHSAASDLGLHCLQRPNCKGRRQIDDIFLIFTRKQDLTIHAMETICTNIKTCFLGKIRKIFEYVICWKFYLQHYVLNSLR